jgi:hypothetical protein
MKQICLVTRLKFLLFGLLIINSCSKFDFDNIKTDNLNTEWGVPLVQSKLTLADFLNDTSGTIHTNEDGLISLIYESKELLSVEASERTKIPNLLDETTKWFNIVPPDTLKSEWFELPHLDIKITFDLDNQCQRIDSLILKSGLFDLLLQTNLDMNTAKIDLIIPNFINEDGDSLKFGFNISNSQGVEISVDTNINLVNYYAQFYNILPDTNTIIIGTDVSIRTADLINIDTSKNYYISLTSELTDIKYSRFYGYIGEHVESYSDTIDLNIFNSADFGSITFGEGCVSMKIDIYNELGLPFKLEAEKFTAYHTSGANPDSFNIYNPFVPNSNSISIISPECDSETGSTTEIIINTDDIVDALEISPNKFYFKLNGILNYDNNISTNCFRDTSDFKIDMKLELDLFGSISDFQIADTLDFSIESVENLNAIELRIDISNGFPINAFAQLDFTDSENQLLFSLFQDNENLIVSAITGNPPDYRVIQPSKKETIVTIVGDDLESLLKASQIIFKSTLSTEPDKLVKIYSDYSIDLTLSAKLYVNY